MKLLSYSELSRKSLLTSKYIRITEVELKHEMDGHKREILYRKRNLIRNKIYLIDTTE